MQIQYSWYGKKYLKKNSQLLFRKYTKYYGFLYIDSSHKLIFLIGKKEQNFYAVNNK